MERIIAAILAGTVVLSLGGAAYADQHSGKRMGDRIGDRMGGHSMGPRIDFDAVDTNKDGKITPAEIAANRAARFTAADTNGDGKLDRAELAAELQNMIADRMADRMAARALDMLDAELQNMIADRMVARALDMLDADRDGALSAEEMAAGPGFGAQMFTRLDADKDGAVTRAELDAMQNDRRRSMRGEHGGHGKRKEDRKAD